ncbi:xylulokinase [Mycolicibacterium arenosum]|uniref:FGGY family carbohydrate kinase n=1 Tax=Mycolicibacterium arenosum TaxID=2952157 RepID=A0ABT1LW43_9MYCO|nr:FGGY family carbohydrate kinase [Mycolicibacterium sp. CAU 1645]MCP9271121.1 FGGY family carbohydrate kinase [Mycolicibacterium sp. CAU 1645]
MTSPLVIAVDCSTTAAKAIIVDGKGQHVGSGSEPLETRSPAPHWFEQHAPDWWRATDRAVQQALNEIGDRRAVAAVCVTHQRESFVCLDADETPIRPAILWMDGRADAEARRYGTERVELLSGKPADITPGLYKLLWLRDREPDTLARCRRVADTHSYLVHAMTGRWVSSTASVDPLALLDQATGDYSDELLELAGLQRDQLPELVPTGTSLGPLRADLADAWGLRPDVTVVAGTGDGQAAGIGLGVTDPGVAYLVLGTAVVIGSETTSYLPSRAYRSMVSAMPGQTTVETFSSSGTFLSTWFRREFGDLDLAGAPDPALERAAAAVPVGSERLLTLPYWNGAQTPHWDGRASGMTLGWQGCHTRAHFYRSLLEGIALELRSQLDGLERARGQRVDVIRAMGGGARSPLWTQILADVFDRPLEVCASGEVSALGAAAIALDTIGEYPSLPEAASAVARTDAIVEPIARNAAQYKALRSVYTRVFDEARDLLHTLHDLPDLPSSDQARGDQS